MARANFVKAAAKDYPQHGIKKGDSYYWWKFRYGGKHFSKLPPKQSQLTQSAYLSQAYAIDEAVGELSASSDLAGEIESIVSDLESLADECESNRSNMPDALQDSETGTLLEERAQACRDAAESLQQADLDDFTEDEDQRETETCEACGGKGEVMDDGRMQKCYDCMGSGETYVEDGEPRNSDGETEDEYWQGRLEEVHSNWNFDIN
jgi:hypothetical protein